MRKNLLDFEHIQHIIAMVASNASHDTLLFITPAALCA
jgi:hypothetical protein